MSLEHIVCITIIYDRVNQIHKLVILLQCTSISTSIDSPPLTYNSRDRAKVRFPRWRIDTEMCVERISPINGLHQNGMLLITSIS